jgi:hypothetical protein
MGDVEKDTPKFSVLGIATAALAFSGLVAALSWELGRLYTNAYFSAFGLSNAITTVSTNEETSRGAYPLAAFLILTVILVFFQIKIFSDRKIIPRIVLYISSHIFRHDHRRRVSKTVWVLTIILTIGILAYLPLVVDDLAALMPGLGLALMLAGLTLIMKLGIGKPNDLLRFQALRRRINIYFQTAIILLSAGILYLWHQEVADIMGYRAGCQDKVLNSPKFTIYSTNPLPLENETIVGPSNNLYQYSGYYGLVGDDYLVLYNDMTFSNTPTKIFYIKKSAVYSYSTEQDDDMKGYDVYARCEDAVRKQIQTFETSSIFQIRNR